MIPAQEILGALVLNASLLDCCDLMSADFPAGRERDCFEAISAIWEEVREPQIDQALLADKLGGDGAATYVSSLTAGNYAGSTESFRVRVKAFRKRAIEARLLKTIEHDTKAGCLSLKGLRPDLELIDKLDAEDQAEERSFLRTGLELQDIELRFEWTIEKLLPARSLTLLHSRGGLGKTWVSLALAQAVSAGEPFLGLETKRRTVYYVDFENPLPLLVERVRKLNIADVNFWHLSADRRPPKLDGPDWTLYKKSLAPGSLIVIDTLRAAHDGDENSSQDAAIVMNRLKEIREAGHDIVALHHTGKVNDRIYKGSTAWSDLADHVLDFHRVKKENLEEIEDDDQDPDALFSLGTGEKTRFAPFRLYLSFDPETGIFNTAQDPKSTALDQIADYIRGEGAGQNQGAIIEWAKEAGVGPRMRQSFIALLQRGEREGRWRSFKGLHGARIYEPSRS